MSVQRPKPKPGAAEVELIVQWEAEGPVTFYPDQAVRLQPELCTWVHTKLPEFDAAGRRTTRTDWGGVRRCLQRFALPLPGTSHQSALGTPLSGNPGVLTALGPAVARATDNRYGTRSAIRLGRIALVPVTDTLLLSARHRDGLEWIDPTGEPEAEVLRKVAMLKRDPYRATGLLAGIDAKGRISADTSAQDLAVEIILAATQAYPRAVLDKFSEMLGAAEASFASIAGPADLDGETQPQNTFSLLRLIAAMAQLEKTMQKGADDFENRTKVWEIRSPGVDEVAANFSRMMHALAQLRSDTRTTVDMIGSTLASAHLRIARQEARAASEQRQKLAAEAEKRREAENEQREREQRLARSIALLTSVLLIPTLVASIFGANVDLPREHTASGTELMFASMISLGALSYTVLREFDSTRRRPDWGMRALPLLIAAVASAAAVVISLGLLGP